MSDIKKEEDTNTTPNTTQTSNVPPITNEPATTNEQPEVQSSQPPIPAPKKTEKTVEVDRKVWDAMVEKMDKVENFLMDSERRNRPFSASERADMGKYVKVHFYKGMPVIAYGRTHKRKDDDGQQVLFIEIVTSDETLHLVHMLDYFNDETNHQLCKVKETKERNHVEGNEVINATVVDFDNYRSSFQDKQVRVEVVYRKRDYVVTLENGDEITVNESVVN